jgi:hypothetical protein
MGEAILVVIRTLVVDVLAFHYRVNLQREVD